MTIRTPAILAAALMIALPLAANAATKRGGETESAGNGCNKPARVEVPDGKTASKEQMEAANSKVTAFIKETNEYLQCMSREMQSAQAEGKRVSEDYQKQVSAYNATPAKQ